MAPIKLTQAPYELDKKRLRKGRKSVVPATTTIINDGKSRANGRPARPSSKPEKDKSLEQWIWDAACSIRGAKDALGYVEGVSGNRREAAKTLSELEALSKQRFITAYGVALVYAGIGEKDKSFEWLKKAFDERLHWLVWLRLDPRWDVLRSDPRFGELLARMHYP